MGRIAHSRANRAAFLRCLAEDLSVPGYLTKAISIANATQVLTELAAIDPLMRLRHRRTLNLQKASDLISRAERRGIIEEFADPSDVDLGRLRPEIVICRSALDLDRFAYCQLLQNAPTSRRIGRQIRALIYDVGQRRPALLGVLLLSSGPYTLGDRDDYFQWRERDHIKQAGLRRTLDLAVCMALPPYSFVLGGKLIAALALSLPICSEFRQRYDDELLALVSTCMTGLHCAMFNRIGLRRGGLYRRIGVTSGYSTAAISSRTLRIARCFLPEYESAPEGEFSISVRPIHILRRALQNCGVPTETILRASNPKGIYIGLRSDHHLRALQKGVVPRSRESLTTERVAAYWRERVLPKACSQPHRVHYFRSFSAKDIALSRSDAGGASSGENK